jgi:hypothetical protein
LRDRLTFTAVCRYRIGWFGAALLAVLSANPG